MAKSHTRQGLHSNEWGASAVVLTLEWGIKNNPEPQLNMGFAPEFSFMKLRNIKQYLLFKKYIVWCLKLLVIIDDSYEFVAVCLKYNLTFH